MNPATIRMVYGGDNKMHPYMPVPRCEDCRFWGQPNQATRDNGTGVCTELSKATEIFGIHLMLVRKDFGCVQWESK